MKPAAFFEALRDLGPMRVISQCGPSTFEAICEIGRPVERDGYLNVITSAYHWHIALEGLGWVQSRDEVHARSGRRVLFFELRTAEEAPPFLRIYLYRPPKQDFESDREARFAALHTQLRDGADFEFSASNGENS